MHEILFRGQTLHFKNTLAGGTQPFISYFPPVSEARRSICFPVFVPVAACQVVSVAGRRAHVRSSSLVTDERDDGGGGEILMKNEGARGLSNTARLRRPPRWRDRTDAP